MMSVQTRSGTKRPLVVNASVTPFNDAGHVDPDAMQRLCQWGLDSGTDGFFLFGNMGEWDQLTLDEMWAIASAACDVLHDRSQIILGIHDLSLSRTLAKAERLAPLRHTHYALLLPNVLGGISDPVGYVHAVADRVDRPLFLYYLPRYNGVQLDRARFRELMQHPNVVGVKNSAAMMRERKELQILRSEIEFTLLEGDEWALDEALFLGHDGFVAGFGTMGARALRQLADAAGQGDWQLAQQIQRRLIEVFHQVYSPSTRFACAGQKYGLYRMGLLQSPQLRRPLPSSLPQSQRQTVDACLAANPDWFAVQPVQGVR